MLALFFLSLLTPLVSGAREGRPWSLEDCIIYAIENNLRLQQQRLGVEISEENLRQSRAGRFPSLNANASHNYNYGRILDPITNEFATETVQTNNFSIGSGVTLFGGFQLRNNVDRDRYELEASRHDVALFENDISLAVASAYLQILFSMEIVDMAVNQLEITRQQVVRTRQLVDAGTLARGSLLSIQAQEATEELQLVNAENQLEIAYLELIQLLDLRDDEFFQIEVPDIELIPTGITGHSPVQIYDTAVQIQPDVLSAGARVRSAEKGYAIARGGRSPVLSLSGSMGTGYSEARVEFVEAASLADPRLIARMSSVDQVFGEGIGGSFRAIPFWDQLDANLNMSLGLFLRIPIFNGFQTRASIGRSRINLENSRLQHQIVRDQLFKIIQQAHQDAHAALQRYLATEKNMEALEESFRYTEQRFNVGMVNILEYNDAKNRLTRAQSEMLQSKYEYVFRVSVLDFYIGNPIRL